jgi:cytochrome c oxidase subunit 2
MNNKTAIVSIGAGAALIGAAFWALMSRYPMMPEAASAQAAYVDQAWEGLLVVEGAIYALVVSFILYCLWAFRARRREEQGAAFSSSRGHWVETSWILASIALTLGLAALGAQELRALINNPEADIDVEVRAEQFSWEFYYPQYKTYGDKLYMERGKRHRIILTSKDVVHSFWVPEFRVKQDAVPGKVIPLIITPVKDGDYTLLCNQLCGARHTEMQGLVEVQEHEAFEQNMKSEF